MLKRPLEARRIAVRWGWSVVLGSALCLSGCGMRPVVGKAHASSAASAPRRAMTFITEPEEGFAPWREALAAAKTGVDVNAYLLTDRTYIHQLIQLAARGIPVRVLLDRDPYGDSRAPHQEFRAFAGTRVKVRWAPARFSGSYAFDHAKYLVVNPGTPQAIAILGSANGTASALDGDNVEDDLETTEPDVTEALDQVFQADWTNRPVGASPRHVLVVSPGSQSALATLLRVSSTHPIAVMMEELGTDFVAYHALASAGPRARVLIPYTGHQTVREQDIITYLQAAGVHVRGLRQPYLHAKLIVGAGQTFIGSQNFSVTSMESNREVGLITTSPAIHASALAWFNHWWAQAQPLGPSCNDNGLWENEKKEGRLCERWS
ncbi:hypothetical protein BXT84_00630 [Sulfobacillus thermotolerans]|uniref:phospholipase D n=1 Tax=Sulfobacillus thermotolerans TaxID=338644 RepID=A0ABM6RMT6_9FIRM|nr:hypothetical protein BXT84_00630 [Sulfobacillus thermotolerans]